MVFDATIVRLVCYHSLNGYLFLNIHASIKPKNNMLIDIVNTIRIKKTWIKSVIFSPSNPMKNVASWNDIYEHSPPTRKPAICIGISADLGYVILMKLLQQLHFILFGLMVGFEIAQLLTLPSQTGQMPHSLDIR